MESKHRTGLTLSGGGARAFAHIGILKALLESDLKPDIISAGSTGAVVGCLYADGYSPQEILEIMKEESLLRLFYPKVSVNSLFKDSYYVNKLKKHFRSQTFEDLDIAVFISTIDFLKGDLHFFSSGDLFLPLEASVAIPVLFKPVKIGQSFYCDGGALSNLPVEGIRDTCEFLIGANVNPLRPVMNTGNLKEVAERTIRLVLTPNIKANVHYCDLFIEPDSLSDYSLLDFDKADEIFEIGYDEGMKIIRDWQKLQEKIYR